MCLPLFDCLHILSLEILISLDTECILFQPAYKNEIPSGLLKYWRKYSSLDSGITGIMKYLAGITQGKV